MPHNLRNSPDLTHKVSACLTTLCAMHMYILGVTPASAATASPAITSVTVSYSISPPTITITGKNFGTTTPGVTLDGIPLEIDLYTSTAVVAVLPSSLTPGSYQLVLTDSATALQGAFDATIGAAGPEGPAGAQGPAGNPGTTGPRGAAGPAGPAGTTGATGPQGPAGPIGLQGPQGVAGPAGPTGPQGLTWQGPWNISATYALNAAVSYSGSTYISLIANNIAIEPDLAPAAWSLVASAGAQGAPGIQGPAGQPGMPGPQGLAGPAGPAGPTGPQGAAGVAGPAGPTGPQGPQGPAGLNAIYSTTTQPNTELNLGVTTLATLSLPTGAYLISSMVTLQNESVAAGNGTCVIAATGPGGSLTYYYSLPAPSAVVTLTPQGTVNFFNGPASVSLQCSAATSGILAEIAQLMAVQATNFVAQ